MFAGCSGGSMPLQEQTVTKLRKKALAISSRLVFFKHIICYFNKVFFPCKVVYACPCCCSGPHPAAHSEAEHPFLLLPTTRAPSSCHPKGCCCLGWADCQLLPTTLDRERVSVAVHVSSWLWSQSSWCYVLFPLPGTSVGHALPPDSAPPHHTLPLLWGWQSRHGFKFPALDVTGWLDFRRGI